MHIQSKAISKLVALFFSVCIIGVSSVKTTEEVSAESYPIVNIESTFDVCSEAESIDILTDEEIEAEEPIEVAEAITYETQLSQEEIELIALVTMAEAEGESEEGKRLVIDTILNRVDSLYFPNTVYDVIYQQSQFSSMWNGRVDRCYVMNDICELVLEECQSRTNYDTIFFTAGGYSKYGVPMFQVGNHYFSSYE